MQSPWAWDALAQIQRSCIFPLLEDYLSDLLKVWREAHRVLVPNGKLCINTPIVPVPKKVLNDTHTRHLKNLNNDIEATILNDKRIAFQRFSLYIWLKQTSVKCTALGFLDTLAVVIMPRPPRPRKHLFGLGPAYDSPGAGGSTAHCTAA